MMKAVESRLYNTLKFAVMTLVFLFIFGTLPVPANAEEIDADNSGPRIIADKTKIAAGETTTFHVEFYTEKAVASEYDNLSSTDPIQSVSWRSSDQSIASVSVQNVADDKVSAAVMGLKDGTATISAMVILNNGSVYELKEDVTVSGLNYVNSRQNEESDSAADTDTAAETEEIFVNTNASGPTLTAEKTKINVGSSTALKVEYDASTESSEESDEDSAQIVSVTWATSDAQIAEITEQDFENNQANAVVTGVNSGTATITASVTAADGQTYELKQKIKIKDSDDSSEDYSSLPIIQLNASKKTITVGDSTTFKVEYNGSENDNEDDENGNNTEAIETVIWSSSDSSVASVEQESANDKEITGTVTGNSVGTAEITAIATTEDGQTFELSQNIKVKEEETYDDTEPSLTAKDTLIAAGGTTTFKVQFNAIVTDSNGKEVDPIKSVSWASSDENIATVSEKKESENKVTATVTGINPGTATITAAVVTGNDRTYKFTQDITVSKYELVYEETTYDNSSGTDVHLNGSYVGSTASFSLAHDAGESIFWSVSDPSIAQMDIETGDTEDKGTLTFKQEGTVLLEAKSNLTGLLVGSKTIEVEAYVKNLTFQSSAEQRMIVGDTLLLRYSITDALGREVSDVPEQVGLTAESSDKSIAKVKSCENGEMEIIALRSGSAVISLSVNDGSEAHAEINITVVANGDAAAITNLQ